MKIKDLTGMVFGRLAVLSIADEKQGDKYKWLCQCSCGNLTIKTGSDMKKGNTTSCGCLAKELSSERATKHGMSSSKEYSAWQAMIDRCNRKGNEYYHKYGGRGIEVCEEWINDFSTFLNDMGKAPTKEHSIERIDNDGNYEPYNCKWATKQEQSQNRSNTVWIEYNGETKCLSEWARIVGVSNQTFRHRVMKFGIELAMTMPLGRWSSK